nr:MAG TPA: hypothetical protein [Caudoviricetes sp.]
MVVYSLTYKLDKRYLRPCRTLLNNSEKTRHAR